MNRLNDSSVMVLDQNISDIHPESESKNILDVIGVTSPHLNDISFSIRNGEVLGITGDLDSGTANLIKLIMGIHPITKGKIILRNTPISNLTTGQIMLRGVFYLSNKKTVKKNELMANSITNLQVNLIMCNQSHQAKWINWENPEVSNFTNFCSDYHPESISQLVAKNPEQMLFGNCFSESADLLIFEDPPFADDSSDNSSFADLVKGLSDNGNTIMIISSNTSELIKLSHRMLFMDQGKISVELTSNEITQESILNLIND